MLKIPVTYKDFDGNEQTEEFYFHLGTDEIAEMEMEAISKGKGPSLEVYLQDVVKNKQLGEHVLTLKWIMSKSYGVRSEDGKRFIKKPELWEEFTQTAAYQELFFDLATDATKNAEFVVGILPGDFNEKMARLQAAQSETQKSNEDQPKRLEEFAPEELLEMSDQEFAALIKRQPGNNLPKAVVNVAMRRQLRKE